MVAIKARALRKGDKVGVFTPSFPAHTQFRQKYLHGLDKLKNMGFSPVEGRLTAAAMDEGYRSGSPKERANEFMELVADPSVSALIATIGGENSSSMIPFLDFDLIRRHPKVICGYSDVTSLHLAILKFSGLSTFYGPAIVPSWGEWPAPLDETMDSFLLATSLHLHGRRELLAPKRWSCSFHDARTDAWKTESRVFKANPGWKVLRAGEACAPVIACNLNTLLANAGTSHFPDLHGKILIIEEMVAPLAKEERSLRQLELMGVFDVIQGLIIGKPEVYDSQKAPFGFEELVLEIAGDRGQFPIVLGFDCGHTHPMLTIPQMAEMEIQAPAGGFARVFLCEPMVEDRS